MDAYHSANGRFFAGKQVCHALMPLCLMGFFVVGRIETYMRFSMPGSNLDIWLNSKE